MISWVQELLYEIEELREDLVEKDRQIDELIRENEGLASVIRFINRMEDYK